jgi:hypothetical protein
LGRGRPAICPPKTRRRGGDQRISPRRVTQVRLCNSIFERYTIHRFRGFTKSISSRALWAGEFTVATIGGQPIGSVGHYGQTE